MGVHLVGFVPPAEIPVDDVGPFRGRMSILARRVSVGSEPVVVCHKGGRPHTVEDCSMCSRFAEAIEDPALGESTVHCVWTHRDPVSARMTDASALVVVARDTPGGEADAIAGRAGVHHLPVVDGAGLVGLVCRCDLTAERSGVAVGAFMGTEIFAVHPTASLGAAASAMRALQVRCLPVVARGILVGILTTSDLEQAGIPPSLFQRCGATAAR